MFLEVTGGEELYRVKKTEGERRMKEQPSPASKRLRDSILSPFFHSYIFAMYKNEALWI